MKLSYSAAEIEEIKEELYQKAKELRTSIKKFYNFLFLFIKNSFNFNANV